MRAAPKAEHWTNRREGRFLKTDDRKHLTALEVDKLLSATKGHRNEARDRCLLLMMFRHGLRVSEACGLELSRVDIESRVLHVARLKKGLSTTHPIRPDEIKIAKAWLAIRAKMKPETDAFFVSERRGPLSRKTAWLRSAITASWPVLPCPPTPSATPLLRLCPCGSRRGHAANSRLSRTPRH